MFTSIEGDIHLVSVGLHTGLIVMNRSVASLFILTYSHYSSSFNANCHHSRLCPSSDLVTSLLCLLSHLILRCD